MFNPRARFANIVATADVDALLTISAKSFGSSTLCDLAVILAALTAALIISASELPSAAISRTAKIAAAFVAVAAADKDGAAS